MEVNQVKKKNGPFSQKRRKDTLFYLSIVTIPFINFIVFQVYQNYIDVFLFAVKSFNPTTGEYAFTRDLFVNFKNFFYEIANDPSWEAAIKVSLKGYVLSWLVGTPLSLFVPLYIVKKCLGTKFFKFVLMLPSMISSMVWVLVYTNFVEGPLVELLSLEIGPLSNKETQWTTIWIQGLITGFGGSMLMYVGIYSGVSDNVLEAAKIDGMGVLREFWHLYFPVLYPIWVVGAATGLMGLFGGQGPIEYFGYSANEEVRTIGYILFCKVMASSSPSDVPLNTAGTLVFTFTILPIVLILKWVLTRYGPSEDSRQPIQWFWLKWRKKKR